MSTKKPKVKSTSNRRKANAKLGYGETNKNINTLRKIEQAQNLEKDNDEFGPFDTSELDSDDDIHTHGLTDDEFRELDNWARLNK